MRAFARFYKLLQAPTVQAPASSCKLLQAHTVQASRASTRFYELLRASTSFCSLFAASADFTSFLVLCADLTSSCAVLGHGVCHYLSPIPPHFFHVPLFFPPMAKIAKKVFLFCRRHDLEEPCRRQNAGSSWRLMINIRSLQTKQ
jgi:hypothetical protein